MNKQICFCLSLLLLLLCGLPALSTATTATRIYTIKQGDTLWGVSTRFIKDPYYWPTLWANNPDITNPHLIYPGQKVQLYDGRIELVPEYPGSSKTTATAPTPVVTKPAPVVKKTTAAKKPAKQAKLFKVPGEGEGFIKTNEISLGTLVDSNDSRTLLTKGDQIFLHMKNPEQAKEGDTYSLFCKGPKISHPLTKKPFGTMMYNLGFVQVTEINGKTVVGKIGEVYREIERGAELFEYTEPNQTIELKRARGELFGNIVAGQQTKLTQGENDVIYVDLGRSNGLQTGNILYISRPRHATALANKQKNQLQLPDALLGAAVVVETHNQSAAALIFKSVAEMQVGDQVMAATE